MERKGQTNKSRGYMLFTGAMILCCIGLYLAQGISWPGRAPAEPTPSPTPTARQSAAARSAQNPEAMYFQRRLTMPPP